MAIVNQPTPLANELAWNGDKNPIPDTNDGSKGLFSLEYGFPYVTQQPLAQGGIPPQRNDFNGVLNLLSKFIRYFQNGGVFAYSSVMDYSVGMLVRNGDRLYVCKAENGANTSAGVQNISNSNYWNEITLEDTLGDTLTNQLKTVLVTEAEVANNTTDWNSLTESRTYKISGATFSATYHQPVGANGNGELVVLKNGTDTIVQVYYANSTQPDQAGAFHRIYFGGTWTNWVYDITNQGGTINGNLNVDGNLGVTGNSNINGKLTVDSLDIKNNFIVAGGTPVTGDDLQKVQDQIIAPEQHLYIDSINGSDEIGDGRVKNPYKTINKAYTAIKTGVPIVIFELDNTTQKDYVVTGMDFSGMSNLERIIFKPKNWDALHRTTVNLIVQYGKLPYDTVVKEGVPKTSYAWGTVLLRATGKEVNFVGINISVQEGYTDSKYASYLLECKNLNFNTCSLNLGSLGIMLSRQVLGNSFDFESGKLEGSTGLFLVSSSANSIDDPSININNINYPIDTLDTSFGVVYVYNSAVVVNTSVPDEMLASGNRGIANNIHVIYKNWS